MTSAAAPVNSNNNDTAMTTTPAMGNMAIATNGQTTEKTTIEPVVSVKIFFFDGRNKLYLGVRVSSVVNVASHCEINCSYSL